MSFLFFEVFYSVSDAGASRKTPILTNFFRQKSNFSSQNRYVANLQQVIIRSLRQGKNGENQRIWRISFVDPSGFDRKHDTNW